MKDTLGSVAFPVCLAVLISWALFAGAGSRVERTRDRSMDAIAQKEAPGWKAEAVQLVVQWQANIGQHPAWLPLKRIPRQ